MQIEVPQLQGRVDAKVAWEREEALITTMLPEVRDLEEVPDPVARDEEDARQRAFDDAHLRFSFLRRG